MSSYIDFRTLPANVPSLCIPRVFANVDESRIRRIFDDLNLGVIERVDIVHKTTEKGEKSNRVFIHFRHWFNNKNADTSRERLLNGKEIKIIYDDPWFWKVSAYREANKTPQNVKSDNQNQKRASIQFDSDEDNQPQRRPIRPLDDRRPIRPLDDRRPRDDDRRPRRPDDRRPDDRRPRNDDRRPTVRTKETREKHVNLVHQNTVHTPRSPSSSPPRTRKEENIDEQFISQCQVKAAEHKSHYDSQMDVAPPVVYDMNVINSTKKRRIIVRKDPPKVDKVEIKEESSDNAW